MRTDCEGVAVDVCVVIEHGNGGQCVVLGERLAVVGCDRVRR